MLSHGGAFVLYEGVKKRRNTVTSVALLSRISAEEMRAHLHDSKDLWSTTLHQTLLCNCIEGEDDESDCAFHFQYMPMRNRIEVKNALRGSKV